MGSIGENSDFNNFAPFVRQTGEGKAQTCAIGILHQLSDGVRDADLTSAIFPETCIWELGLQTPNALRAIRK